MWGGSEAEVARQWLEWGAQPFDEPDHVADQMQSLFGVSGPGVDAAASPAESVGGMSLHEGDLPAFSSADEALDALGRGGRVPAVLARRIREMGPHD